MNNRGIIAKTSTEKRDARRWLIIGAYQAGASTKEMSRMSGVTQSSVRRIVLNFQKTGSPTIPKGLTKREKLKPIIEYDEEGNVVDSEEEEEEEEDSMEQDEPSSFKQKIRARKPSAKDLIAYVLSKAQRAERKEALFVKHAQEEEGNKWRPPTPPRDPLHQSDQETLSDHSRSILSPPLSDSSPKQKYDSIRGYEAWTMEDDRILMAHVLTRLSGCRWKEAEAKLRGRHSAARCEERWEILRNLLIRGADKTGTIGW